MGSCAISLFYIFSCYLNPDEAVHFSAARSNSWSGAYEASLAVTHPPLFILILHGILFFGRTEFALRLPSLISVAAALWITFAWLRRSFGEIFALSGLLFMAFSPMTISAASEVRQYGVLLFFVCAALYATERMFSERSARWTLAQGFFLLGALLTHYIALVVIAAIGAYTVIRFVSMSAPRRVVFTFAGSHFVLSAVLAFLYFSQIRTLIAPTGATDYLRRYYYQPGQETAFGFVGRMVSRTFGHAIGMNRLSLLPLLLFAAGLAAIVLGRTKSSKVRAVLIASPFVVGFAAGVLSVFPFAGSRHQAYLLPFLAAGIAASLGWLDRRAAVSMLLAGLIVAAPLWVMRAVPDNNIQILRKNDMREAVRDIHRDIPAGSTLFVDYSTRAELEYYLAKNDPQLDALHGRPTVEWLGGYRVVVPENYLWSFKSGEVLPQMNKAAGVLHLSSSQPLWIFWTGWVEASLVSGLSPGLVSSAKEFGHTSLIRTTCYGGYGIERLVCD